ncbi:hypothetical protein [Streptosporangium sp. KLBMP 9127]|nr:hypothetical protein [Streptosporangium sp. KLBMP 9127]
MSMARFERSGPRASGLETESVESAGVEAEADGEDDPIAEQEASGLIAAAVAEAEQELAPGLVEGEGARQVRLEQDHRIVLLLQQDLSKGCSDRFNKTAGQLLGYGLPILVGWLQSEKIFARVNEIRTRINQARMRRGLPALPPVERAMSDWRRHSQDDIDQLAFELAEEGIKRFRRTVEEGRWSPDGGAALTTYYVGGCLIAFEAVYRRWCKSKVSDGGVQRVGLADDLDGLPTLRPARMRGPEEQVVVWDEIRRTMGKIKDPQMRQVVWDRGQGYTQAEAATRNGLTEKAAEGRSRRIRKNLCKENPAPQAQADPDGAER